MKWITMSLFALMSVGCGEEFSSNLFGESGGAAGVSGTSGSSGVGGISDAGGSAGDSGVDGQAGGSGVGGEAGDSGVDGQAGEAGSDGSPGGMGGSSGSTSTGGSGGSSGTAGTDSGPPTGPCGVIIQTGWSICVYGVSHSNGNVGMAGGIAPNGVSMESVWNDPFNWPAGCVNPVASQDWALCPLGSVASKSTIQFAHGIHTGPNGSTAAGGYSCDTVSCTGSAVVYKDGVVVGGMTGSIPSGSLQIIPHFLPPGRLDLRVVVP